MKNTYLLLLLLAAGNLSLSGQKAIIVWDTTEIPSVDLTEIEIRASKQNTQVKKLPASVSLISEKAIAMNEIQSLKDISGITPGFFMPDYGSKLTSPVYIRGIGSRINSPSVGLYVDHVPYVEKAAFEFDFFDIERIEVLKGPQGTLYGRNTMGGIINIATLSPLNHQGTRLFVSGGSHGNFAANIGHYGGDGESFGFSLSGNYRHSEGYYTNIFNNSPVDRSNTIGLRNRMEWRINDRVEIENIASAELSSEGGYPYAVINDSLQVPEEINYNMPSSYKRNLFSDALLIRYLGSDTEILSTTSYQYLDDLQRIDQDFTPDSAYFVEQDQQQHMLSQEVIIKSTGSNRVNWLVGGYGFIQQFDKSVAVEMYQRNMTLFKDYNYAIAGAAAFSQATLNDLLTEGLSLTAGIRLDYEKDMLDYLYDSEMGSTMTNVMDTLFPALSYFRLLPKVALNYVSGRTSVYAVVASGYKSGGFNSTFYRDEELFFEPEDSWNYEVGIKTSLFDRTVYTDIALFFIDWKNQQIYQTARYDDGSPAPGSFLSNAGQSVSKGGEVTVKTIPFMGITPAVSYGYTHAVFTRHIVDEDTDLGGNAIPYVPRHTLTAQASRSFYLHNNNLIDEVGINLLYRGLGRIYWNEENTYSTGFYSLLDLKIILSRKDMHLELWGKNLLNTSYESFYFQAIGNQYVQMGKPLRFGLNLRYSF